MSANRKLQFLSLTGEKEAQALESLLSRESCNLTFHDEQSRMPFLINCIHLAALKNQKLALVLSNNTHQNLERYLRVHGFEFNLFEYRQRTSKTYLATIMEAKFDPTPSIKGLWNQMYNLSEIWHYRHSVLFKKTLSDQPLENVIKQWFALDQGYHHRVLDRTIAPQDFEFDSKEYAFLRGRINQGCQLYRSSFTQLKGLTQLHPVFFDMYSADEAYIVVHELIRKIGTQVLEFKKELYRWFGQYHQAQKKEMDFICSELRQRLIHLRQGVVEAIQEDKKNVNEGSKWKSIFQGNDAKADQNQGLVTAYRKISDWLDQAGYPEILNQEAVQSLEDLQFTINNQLGEYAKIKRKLKRTLDRHITKLNRHTTRSDEMSESMTRINFEIREMILEVNGYQIFNDHWEDHSLDMEQQLDMICSLEDRICLVEGEMDHLKNYIKWNHFIQSMDKKGQSIIQELKNEPIDLWVPIFDHWYLSHFIQCQDLVGLSQDHVEQEWLPLQRNVRSKTIRHVMGKMSQSRQDNWNAYLKTHKAYKKWWDKGIDYDQAEADILDYCNLESIVIFGPEEVERVRQYQPDWVVTDLSNVKPEVDKFSIPSAFIEMTKSTSTDHGLYHSNLITSNILKSTHTDRIEAIQNLVQILMHSDMNFELLQSSKEVLLMSVSKEWGNIVSEKCHKGFERLSKEHIDSEKWTEALLNNSNRKFTVLYSEIEDDERRTYFPFAKAHILEQLHLAGCQIAYLCWTKPQSSFELLNQLCGEERKPNTDAHLARRTPPSAME